MKTTLTCCIATVVFAAFPLRAQTPQDSVELPKFSVSSSKERGYQASNAVSASKINTPIAQLPISVQAFTSEFLADINPTSLLDIQRFSPGVSSQAGGFVAGTNQATIRGFTNTPYMNGFAGAAGAFLDPYNLERVEIVKGPSSLLYGQVSPGGLVNLITKRPDDKTSVSLQQSIGSWATSRTIVDANVSAGQIGGVRVTGLYQENEMWVYGHNEKRIGVSPSAHFKLSPTFSLALNYEYFEQDEKRPWTVPVNGPLNGNIGSGPYVRLGRGFSFAGDKDYRETKVTNFNPEITGVVADFSVRLAAFFTDRRTEMLGSGQANGKTSPTPNISNQLSGSGIFMWRRVRFETAHNSDRFVQADLARSLKWSDVTIKTVIGVEKGRRYLEQFQSQAPNSSTRPDWNLLDSSTWVRTNLVSFPHELTVLNFNQASQVDLEGFYGLIQASVLREKLHVLAGIRRDKAVGKNTSFVSGRTTAAYNTRQNSPQVGAIYQVNPNMGFFASYSRSFVPQSGTRVVNDIPQGPLPPIVGKGYDIGVKTSFDEGRYSSTISYFSLENTGAYQTIFTPDLVTGQNRNTSVPAGVQRSRGIEAEGTFNVDKQLQIYASYAYLDAKIIQNLANPALVGSLLPAVPKRTANILAKYTFSSGRFKGLSIGGGANYVSRKLARVDNLALFIDEYTLLSAFASYDWKWSDNLCNARLSVNNALDRDYLESTFLSGAPCRVTLSTGLRF